MRRNYLLIFAFIALFKVSIGNTNKDTLKALIVYSLKDIINADTNFIYDYVDVYELDSLIHRLEFLERLHFRKLFYQGHIRKNFPYSLGKVEELKEVSVSGRKLKDLPSFIIFDSLVYLNIEANNYRINFELSKCTKLERLALYTKNTYEKLDQICLLNNLKALVIQERSGKVLKDLGCLKNLKKISFLYLSLSTDHLNELLAFTSLDDLYIANRISYDSIRSNISFFKKMKQIHFLDFHGSTEQENMLRKELEGIWSRLR